jgi:hypothetical protein
MPRWLGLRVIIAGLVRIAIAKIVKMLYVEVQ